MKVHPNVTVMNGNIQFVANRRLCVKQIEEFVTAVRLVNATLDFQIYSAINGDKAVCKP
jgi:predicted phosphatase